MRILIEEATNYVSYKDLEVEIGGRTFVALRLINFNFPVKKASAEHRRFVVWP